MGLTIVYANDLQHVRARSTESTVKSTVTVDRTTGATPSTASATPADSATPSGAVPAAKYVS